MLISSLNKRAGHGSDNNNCAEFCPTAHTFAVNGAEHTLNFTVAGTGFGCTAQVRAQSSMLQVLYTLSYLL